MASLSDKFSFEHILATLFAAIIIGVGSSYVATKVQLGSLETRVARNEVDITDVREDLDNMRSNLQPLRRDVIRLNTKMDILLDVVSDTSERAAIRP